jgi:ATP-dependent protease ClpP protease subunit
MINFEKPQPALRARLVAEHRSAKKWYRIDNAAGDEAEIYIYEEIGFWGTNAKQFLNDLKGVTAGTINLHLNSPGGDVFDGLAIYNALKQHSAQVNVYVDALAASISSVIAMAGDTVHMAPSSYLMIHNAWMVAVGDSTEMRKGAELLDKIDGTIADVYAAKGNKTAKEYAALMGEETWLTAQEALDAGLADVIIADGGDAAGDGAENRFDLSLFSKVPEQLKSTPHVHAGPNKQTPQTKREMEEFLRDAGGFSHAAAKAIVAGGFKAKSDPRDEDELLATVRAHVAATKRNLNPNSVR